MWCHNLAPRFNAEQGVGRQRLDRAQAVVFLDEWE
jgi:hypothetical protein